VSTPKASLKPHLGEIRAWVAQGRTDIWIAHTLSSTPASISAFRSAHGILRRNLPGEVSGSSVPPPVVPPDARIPEPEVRPRRRSRSRRQAAPAEGAAATEAPRRRRSRAAAPAETAAAVSASQTTAASGGGRRRKAAAAEPAATTAEPAPAAAQEEQPRRRRRGGRGRRNAHTFEAVLDHGEEGYGFWLDGAVRDDAVFREHWSARRALVVRIEADQIVVRPDERSAAG
jgi:hypothetical protein